jgi:hypothetical protein
MCPHFKENNGNGRRMNLVIRSEKLQNLTFRRRSVLHFADLPLRLGITVTFVLRLQ